MRAEVDRWYHLAVSKDGNETQRFFVDGLTSTLMSPSHTYTQAGVYTVSLRDNNDGGGDTLTRTHYLTVTEALTAGFSAFPLSGPAPLTVQFFDNSTGATSYHWDFGDGVTASQPSPTHTYTQTGVYTVSLTAGNSSESDTLTRTGYITVTPALVANFLVTPVSGNVPLTVTFTNHSTGAMDYLWDFGNGSSFIDFR